jgi:hypothetical protein
MSVVGCCLSKMHVASINVIVRILRSVSGVTIETWDLSISCGSATRATGLVYSQCLYKLDWGQRLKGRCDFLRQYQQIEEMLDGYRQ